MSYSKLTVIHTSMLIYLDSIAGHGIKPTATKCDNARVMFRQYVQVDYIFWNDLPQAGRKNTVFLHLENTV